MPAEVVSDVRPAPAEIRRDASGRRRASRWAGPTTRRQPSRWPLPPLPGVAQEHEPAPVGPPAAYASPPPRTPPTGRPAQGPSSPGRSHWSATNSGLPGSIVRRPARIGRSPASEANRSRGESSWTASAIFNVGARRHRAGHRPRLMARGQQLKARLGQREPVVGAILGLSTGRPIRGSSRTCPGSTG